MSKGLKIFSGIIGLVIALLAAAIFILVTVIDPNDYKEQISSVVKEKTGRSFSINGNIGWTLFPWLGVAINHVQLGNAPGYGNTPFAKLDEIDVRVKLLPLISGDVQLGNIIIKGLNLHLIQTQSGKTNWDDLINQNAQASKPAPASTKQSSTPQSKPFELKIANIKMINSQLTWDDRKSNELITLSHIRLNSHSIGYNKKFPIDLTFTFTRAKPAFTTKMAMDTDVLIEPRGKGHFQLSDFHMDIDESSIKGLVDVKDFNNPNSLLDLKINSSNIQPFVNALFESNNVTGKANIAAKMTTKGRDYNAISKTANGNINVSFTDGEFKGINFIELYNTAEALLFKLKPPSIKKLSGTQFNKVSATATIKNGLITNKDFVLDSPSIHVTGEGTVNLPTNYIDFIFRVARVKNGKPSETVIPVVYKGPLDSAKPKPEVAGLTGAAVEGTVGKVLKKKGEIINKSLEKLFGE